MTKFIIYVSKLAVRQITITRNLVEEFLGSSYAVDFLPVSITPGDRTYRYILNQQSP
ncbi:hypothetical protein [Nostoc sp. T09]|uniref:hypothetical protein n=1 Tax=Nostoc sp. T09 TaxID=1932621 RepID=UPI001C4F01C5|nr:hypothetical protein [Nostoc sp. T09]